MKQHSNIIKIHEITKNAECTLNFLTVQNVRLMIKVTNHIYGQVISLDNTLTKTL